MSEDESVTVKGVYFNTINTIRAWCSESILNEAMAECQKYNDLLSKTVPGQRRVAGESCGRQDRNRECKRPWRY